MKKWLEEKWDVSMQTNKKRPVRQVFQIRELRLTQSI